MPCLVPPSLLIVIIEFRPVVSFDRFLGIAHTKQNKQVSYLLFLFYINMHISTCVMHFVWINAFLYVFLLSSSLLSVTLIFYLQSKADLGC